jgi:hypothetical protein
MRQVFLIKLLRDKNFCTLFYFQNKSFPDLRNESLLEPKKVRSFEAFENTDHLKFLYGVIEVVSGHFII